MRRPSLINLAILTIVGVATSALIMSCAHAANRTFSVTWSHGCMTVDGDILDHDGDGICEDLNGYRIYTEQGEFVTGPHP